MSNLMSAKVAYVHVSRKDLTLLHLHRKPQPPGSEHLLPLGRHSLPNLSLYPAGDTQNHSEYTPETGFQFSTVLKVINLTVIILIILLIFPSQSCQLKNRFCDYRVYFIWKDKTISVIIHQYVDCLC